MVLPPAEGAITSTPSATATLSARPQLLQRRHRPGGLRCPMNRKYFKIHNILYIYISIYISIYIIYIYINLSITPILSHLQMGISHLIGFFCSPTIRGMPLAQTAAFMVRLQGLQPFLSARQGGLGEIHGNFDCDNSENVQPRRFPKMRLPTPKYHPF